VERGQQVLAEFMVPTKFLPDRHSFTKEVMLIHADKVATVTNIQNI
jgi:hypothetical protein